ncbi:uncharacterized protein K460DRAFT_204967 [Cucurbitaria berberidis CBS 394.84]|uniref:Uncharacterized protein n=1 Tax=Cucurbitaria berberidis CBS 394.84 TaxID=1168544 RepID=A0A9P4G713_9PLEO|nr:uncharacterized protein K460DRAFT_204967 [Cucurbitaria berberidis CBS 394.84]KAF1840211.1 hypothetical protein K460DRAFT_204967 [Cucurbitaria berberidis CBS 394.84]
MDFLKCLVLNCLVSSMVALSSMRLLALPSPSYSPGATLDIINGYTPFSHSSIPSVMDARTWYRIVMPASSLGHDEARNRRPLVIRHLHLRPIIHLVAQPTSRMVIYYDKFGGGNSSRYPESKGNDCFWRP